MILFVFLVMLFVALGIQGRLQSIGFNQVTHDAKFSDISISLIPMAAGALMNAIGRKFFPMGTFAIGDGKRRHEHLEIYRTGVILAAVVSIGSSVFMLLFT